jgi:NDP-sugar pyrophosphorylase family protein
VLLAGHIGRNELAEGIGRSVLDLPVGPDLTIMDVWTLRFAELASDLRLGRLAVHVAIDRDAPEPASAARTARPEVAIEVVRDAAEYRGTAGVVKDHTRDLGDDDRVLVAAAHSIQRERLSAFVPDLATSGDGLSIVGHGSSELAGVFVFRLGRLKDVPDAGFVDLKEQAIPDTLQADSLRVMRRPDGSSMPVRTLDEYIRALRVVHAGGQPSLAEESPFSETWRPCFSLVEPGADVAASAEIQDSVVLAGARVEAGAIVARSVVCPGAVVRRGACVVESVVSR